MCRIDALPLDDPFAGSRMLQGLLKVDGHEVGRRRVSTLMQKMGIEALYRRPKTSTPAPGHKIHPSLLRGLAVRRPDRVWAMDIACVPMARGLVYLAAVLDWFSRKLLAWQLSITREAEFCIEALEAALARHGRPEILNANQGSQQFTSLAFVQVPKDAESAISMDGKGAWRDKVFMERLWRRVKYEEIDLHVYANVPGGARLDWALPGLLQQHEATFVAWRADARSGVHQRAAANPGSSLTQTKIHLAMARTLFNGNPPKPPCAGHACNTCLSKLPRRKKVTQIFCVQLRRIWANNKHLRCGKPDSIY